MRRVPAILAAAMSLWLAGCVLPGRQKTAGTLPPPPLPAAAPVPVGPPVPLSIPQTQVELPPPQAIDPAALATAEPAEAPAGTPPATRPTRRAGPAAPPAKPLEAAAPAPPQVAVPEPERPPIQEIVPAEEQKRLQDSTQANKRVVAQLLQQAQSKPLNRQQGSLVKRIEQFVNLSSDAERNGNMREANEFAQRALVLARELESAR